MAVELTKPSQLFRSEIVSVSPESRRYSYDQNLIPYWGISLKNSYNIDEMYSVLNWIADRYSYSGILIGDFVQDYNLRVHYQEYSSVSTKHLLADLGPVFRLIDHFSDRCEFEIISTFHRQVQDKFFDFHRQIFSLYESNEEFRILVDYNANNHFVKKLRNLDKKKKYHLLNNSIFYLLTELAFFAVLSLKGFNCLIYNDSDEFLSKILCTDQYKGLPDPLYNIVMILLKTVEVKQKKQ